MKKAKCIKVNLAHIMAGESRCKADACALYGMLLLSTACDIPQPHYEPLLVVSGQMSFPKGQKS